MPFVVFGILLFLGLSLIFLFNYSLSGKEGEVRGEITGLRTAQTEASSQKAHIEKEISSLNFILTKIVRMYEASRAICASSLDEDKLLLKFKEDLKKVIDYQECLFLEADKSEEADIASSDATVFPLVVKENHLGFLVIKGVALEQRPYLGILVGQFSLGIQRARLYKMIQELAITDSLTGLYTRRYASERLKEEFQRSAAHKLNLSVLMIDADSFKDCNDKFGHLVGDIVLCEIGNRIKDNIREVDMLSRFGGEEFMVLAPNTSKDRALLIAERIRSGVQERAIRAYDENVKITISIGLSSYPTDAQTTADLIGKADWALYEAKRMGKNRVCVFGLYHE